jgi:hypothetical protein
MAAVQGVAVPEKLEGRDAEVTWLRDRLRRPTLTIVWSAAGLGKTATIAVAFGTMRCVRLSATNAPSPSAFFDAVASQSLERPGVPLWIDDLDALPVQAHDDWLDRISRAPLGAPIVVATRLRPASDVLADRSLHLAPLPDPAIERIVRACARSGSEVAAMADTVRSAAGSPSRARRAALGHSLHAPTALVTSLPVAAVAALDTLRVTDAPMPLDPEIAAMLDRRALVERRVDGFIVAPAMRPLIDAEPLDRESALRRALALLETDPRPVAIRAWIRLALEVGDLAGARARLDRERDRLCAEGWAEDLFDALAGAPELADHRLRCANWVASGRALAWVSTLPPPRAPSDRLLWARLLWHAGSRRRAEAEVALLLDHPAEEVAMNARLLLADCHRIAGRADEAFALLERVKPFDPEALLSRDLRLATLYVANGELARAAPLLDGVAERLRGVDVGRASLLRELAFVALLAAGRFNEVALVLDEVPSQRSSALTFARIALAIESGRWSELSRLVIEARETYRESMHNAWVADYAEARRAVAVGAPSSELAALRAVAERRIVSAREYGWSAFVGVFHGASVALSLLVAPRADLAKTSVATANGEAAVVIDAWDAIAAARRGETRTLMAAGELPNDVALVRCRARAEQAIATADFAAAWTHIDDGLEVARRHGFLVEQLELLALRVDALLASPTAELAEIAAAAQVLDEQAAALGSDRFRDHAALARWLALGPSDPAEGLRLAEAAASPVAARRAGVVLGRTLDLDALDRRVLARWQRGDERMLVVDLARRCVRRPDGEIVTLAKSPVSIHLLEVLVRAGGRASKEDLVRGAWQRRDYHPLRDDKRLQVAVHRLRHALGAEGLLVQDGDGYRFGVPFRVGAADPAVT